MTNNPLHKHGLLKARHGDVMIIPVPEVKGEIVDRTIKFGGRVVENCLKQGEATDHFHRVQNGDVTFRMDGETLYMSVNSESATVVHEEHKPVELSKGNYRIDEQREYHPEKEIVVWD